MKYNEKLVNELLGEMEEALASVRTYCDNIILTINKKKLTE